MMDDGGSCGDVDDIYAAYVEGVCFAESADYKI
jgi:hypothetical protein